LHDGFYAKKPGQHHAARLEFHDIHWMQLVVPNEAARAVRAAMMNSSTVFQIFEFFSLIMIREF
jgi:hypothetical protein